MTRGRKPKPSHLKLVTGNPGKRPLNPNEPLPDAALPEVPAHLSDGAKTEWNRIARELYDLGILTRLDRASLAAYCQAYCDWIEAEQRLQQYGKMVMSPQKTVTRRMRNGTEVVEKSGGYPMQSPYLAIRNKALELMIKFAVEFGLTPSSRSRVNSSGETDGDRNKAAKYFTR